MLQKLFCSQPDAQTASSWQPCHVIMSSTESQRGLVTFPRSPACSSKAGIGLLLLLKPITCSPRQQLLRTALVSGGVNSWVGQSVLFVLEKEPWLLHERRPWQWVCTELLDHWGAEECCMVQALADIDHAVLEKAENEEFWFLALTLPSSATSRLGQLLETQLLFKSRNISLLYSRHLWPTKGISFTGGSLNEGVTLL